VAEQNLVVKKNTTRETGREYRYRILQSDSGKTGRKKSPVKKKYDRTPTHDRL
jgi:hypothetical protein